MTIRVDFSTIPEEIKNYPWDTMLKQGYHWMDKYGEAHWIEDMSLDYLENALRFAYGASRAIARQWWRLAFQMNGEMAIDQAERYAMEYEEGEQPLIKGLENAIARHKGEPLPHSEYELSDDRSFLEEAGRRHMEVYRATEGKLYPTPTPGVYKVGSPWDPDKDA